MTTATAAASHGAELDAAAASVLSTLLYYHVFRFPLTVGELRSLAAHPWSGDDEVVAVLHALAQRGLVVDHGGTWGVGTVDDARRRRAGEAAATAILPRARKRSRLIAHFPFVRAVAVSGTLSKGVMAAGDDVDFLVITAPDRLWICRFLLMAFKKVFLLNSHRNFCVNYLVTADHLAIPDRNLFTATEIAWLLPTVGADLYRQLVAANDWVRTFLPNWRPRPTDGVTELPPSRLRRAIERGLDGGGGDRLDEVCRRLIAAHNRRRYRHLDPALHAVALRTEKAASKHHPRAFQDRVLDEHRRLCGELAARHDLRDLVSAGGSTG